MKKLILIGLMTLALAAPIEAKVLAEQIDGGLYFVSYQANRMVQGGVLFDTQKKNTKKLLTRAHKVCLEEGYSFIHFVAPKEIVQDDTLKAYWDMYAGGEANSQEITSYDGTSSGRANIIKRLVKFSNEDEEGFEKCRSK